WLTLRIYENRPLVDVGLWWNSASGRNLAAGLVGGAGSACLVVAPLIVSGAAHFVSTPKEAFTLGTFFFVTVLLAVGASGEELFFRGYGFQVLVRSVGGYSAVVLVGVIFALLHKLNPNSTWLGVANTAGFGMLFGYAYLRSRDLWLPIGLHF